MVFQCINIRQVPWEELKTADFGLGFQHLPQDLANVNAWKTMFDPYSVDPDETAPSGLHVQFCQKLWCTKFQDIYR